MKTNRAVLVAVVTGWAAIAGCGGDDTTPSAAGGAGGPGSPAELLEDYGVLVGSCIPDDGVNRNIQNYIDNALMPVAATDAALTSKLDCLAAAKTKGCEAVEECLGVKVEIVASECDKACDGSVFSACDDTTKLSMDCSKLGLTCNADEGCIDGAAVACETDAFESACEDGRPTFCTGIVERAGKCEDDGMTCEIVDEAARCVGTGPACDAGSFGHDEYEGLRCDGAKLVACVNGGEHTFDCAAELGAGFACREVSDAFFCGVAAECEPGADSHEKCEGTSVTFCNAGKVETIDCTDYGFPGCTTYGERAACTAPFTSN